MEPVPHVADNCRWDHGQCLAQAWHPGAGTVALIQFTDGSVYFVMPLTWPTFREHWIPARQPGCRINALQHHTLRYRYVRLSGWIPGLPNMLANPGRLSPEQV